MKRAWYLHPFLFAAYPGLNEIAFNVTQNSPLMGGRILVVSILLGAALLLVGWALSREGHRSGFMASIISLTILAYGHVYLLVQSAHMGSHNLGRHVGVLAAWLLIVVLLCSRWAWSRFRNPQRITLFMNVAAIAAVLLPSLKIGWSVASTAIDSVRLNDRLVTLDPGGIHLNGVARPDIYYIVLDGYGREDALRDTHGLDNSGFTGFLESRGFVVADQAQANYIQTALSLASSLNLSYMDTLASVLGPRSQDREPLVALIRATWCARA